MRFPPMPYMDRVIGDKPWSLIPYINQRVSDRDKVVQKPYIFTANNTFRRYNDITSLIQADREVSPRLIRRQTWHNRRQLERCAIFQPGHH